MAIGFVNGSCIITAAGDAILASTVSVFQAGCGLLFNLNKTVPIGAKVCMAAVAVDRMHQIDIEISQLIHNICPTDVVPGLFSLGNRCSLILSTDTFKMHNLLSDTITPNINHSFDKIMFAFWVPRTVKVLPAPVWTSVQVLLAPA